MDRLRPLAKQTYLSHEMERNESVNHHHVLGTLGSFFVGD